MHIYYDDCDIILLLLKYWQKLQKKHILNKKFAYSQRKMEILIFVCGHFVIGGFF